MKATLGTLWSLAAGFHSGTQHALLVAAGAARLAIRQTTTRTRVSEPLRHLFRRRDGLEYTTTTAFSPKGVVSKFARAPAADAIATADHMSLAVIALVDVPPRVQQCGRSGTRFRDTRRSFSSTRRHADRFTASRPPPPPRSPPPPDSGAEGSSPASGTSVGADMSSRPTPEARGEVAELFDELLDEELQVRPFKYKYIIINYLYCLYVPVARTSMPTCKCWYSSVYKCL